MDALPMPEDTGLEFASVVDGAMHACGHDSHVAMLVGAARVVASVIDASAPIRGFHPLGQSRASGFAAMACDELLIHTDDAGRGLGRVFAPDPALCARVLARLFPEAPRDVAPWDGLRWANGRIALPGRPRQQRWRWTCTPQEDG
jgi:hypothetical protein